MTNNEITSTKPYKSELEVSLNRKIEAKLKNLSWHLACRAHTNDYHTNHNMDFSEELESYDKIALRELNDIKHLHEELFNAEVERDHYLRLLKEEPLN